MYMTYKYTHMLGVTLLLLAHAQSLQADEFTSADLQRWQQQYMSVVEKGEKNVSWRVAEQKYRVL